MKKNVPHQRHTLLQRGPMAGRDGRVVLVGKKDLATANGSVPTNMRSVWGKREVSGK